MEKLNKVVYLFIQFRTAVSRSVSVFKKLTKKSFVGNSYASVYIVSLLQWRTQKKFGLMH